MFYFAYAGHNIPPKRIEFGKIQKNPTGPNGGGTRITISGKSPEEKAVWQTLGEGNEDCVEWVVLCAALNLLDDEIIKAAEKNSPLAAAPPMASAPSANSRPTPVSLHDPGPQMSQRGPPSGQANIPPPQNRPPQAYPASRGPGPSQGHPGQLASGQSRQGVPNMGVANRAPPQQTQQARRF
jgi:hypothetical protein